MSSISDSMCQAVLPEVEVGSMQPADIPPEELHHLSDNYQLEVDWWSDMVQEQVIV